jgi:anthranilate synthase component 1
MQLKPDLNRFITLSKNCARIPMVGEIRCEKLDPAQLYQRLFYNQQDSFLLESGMGPESTTRYSMMGTSNKNIISIKNGKAWKTSNDSTELLSNNPIEAFKEIDFQTPLDSIEYIPHFWGGWVGFLGYEIVRLLENLPLNNNDKSEIPDMYFIQVDKLIVYDHIKETLKYIVSNQLSDSVQDNYSTSRNEVQRFFENIETVLKDIQENPVSNPLKNSPTDSQVTSLRPNISKNQYVKLVNKAKSYISEGDIYQANIAQKFEMEFIKDPFTLYTRLKNINPSPFSGFLELKDFSLISSSPERLIKLKNNILETRPIAGTRPRGKDIDDDNALSKELLLNEKEKAEHLMLVDLERSDMGRICEFGSVEVTDFMFLEKYSHVSHIVSNIKGILKPNISVLDIIKAVFPGGTITGCPKIRCMEIINELEVEKRGPYTGSFGYIGFDGQMDLNIIIRTIILKNEKAFFHVGAGIVADSIPEKEYEETLDKAGAMINALSQDYS